MRIAHTCECRMNNQDDSLAATPLDSTSYPDAAVNMSPDAKYGRPIHGSRMLLGVQEDGTCREMDMSDDDVSEGQNDDASPDFVPPSYRRKLKVHSKIVKSKRSNADLKTTKSEAFNSVPIVKHNLHAGNFKGGFKCSNCFSQGLGTVRFVSASELLEHITETHYSGDHNDNDATYVRPGGTGQHDCKSAENAVYLCNICKSFQSMYISELTSHLKVIHDKADHFYTYLTMTTADDARERAKESRPQKMGKYQNKLVQQNTPKLDLSDENVTGSGDELHDMPWLALSNFWSNETKELLSVDAQDPDDNPAGFTGKGRSGSLNKIRKVSSSSKHINYTKKRTVRKGIETKEHLQCNSSYNSGSFSVSRTKGALCKKTDIPAGSVYEARDSVELRKLSYKCRHCKFSSLLPDDLVTHVAEKHSNLSEDGKGLTLLSEKSGDKKDNFSCTQCEFTTTYMMDLFSHVKERHNRWIYKIMSANIASVKQDAERNEINPEDKVSVHEMLQKGKRNPKEASKNVTESKEIALRSILCGNSACSEDKKVQQTLKSIVAKNENPSLAGIYACQACSFTSNAMVTVLEHWFIMHEGSSGFSKECLLPLVEIRKLGDSPFSEYGKYFCRTCNVSSEYMSEVISHSEQVHGKGGFQSVRFNDSFGTDLWKKTKHSVTAPNLARKRKTQLRVKKGSKMHKKDTVDKPIFIYMYVCNVCKQMFPEICKLDEHSREHHGTTRDILMKGQTNVPLAENFTVIEESSKRLLASDMAMASGTEKHTENAFTEATVVPGIHQCQLCIGMFPTYSDLRKHVKESHDDSANVTSSSCGLMAVQQPEIGTEVTSICQLCSAVFTSYADLRNHVNNVHMPGCDLAQKKMNLRKKQLYICRVCGSTFKSFLHLKEHSKKWHNSDSYAYRWCDYDALNSTVPTGHSSQLEKYDCKSCSLSFHYFSDLRSHALDTHRNGPYKAMMGVLPTTRENNEAQLEGMNSLAHGWVNSPDVESTSQQSTFFCSFCNFSSDTSDTIATHIDDTHSRIALPDGIYVVFANSTYNCHDCYNVFSTETSLVEHMKYRHSDSSPDQITGYCSLCSMDFRNYMNLISHVGLCHIQPVKHTFDTTIKQEPEWDGYDDEIEDDKVVYQSRSASSLNNRVEEQLREQKVAKGMILSQIVDRLVGSRTTSQHTEKDVQPNTVDDVASASPTHSLECTRSCEESDDEEVHTNAGVISDIKKQEDASESVETHIKFESRSDACLAHGSSTEIDIQPNIVEGTGSTRTYKKCSDNRLGKTKRCLSYNCITCGERFESAKQLLCHRTTTTCHQNSDSDPKTLPNGSATNVRKKRNYVKCADCFLRFDTVQALLRHRILHHIPPSEDIGESAPLEDTSCNRNENATQPNDQQTTYEVKKYTPVPKKLRKGYGCNVCGSRFLNATELMNHKTAEHSSLTDVPTELMPDSTSEDNYHSVSSYCCGCCCFVSASEKELNTHIFHLHPKGISGAKQIVIVEKVEDSDDVQSSVASSAGTMSSVGLNDIKVKDEPL